MARKTGSIGEVTASRVRLAALELFAKEGYAAVSMRAIASKIGIQASALYNHFPNKQALLVDLLETHMLGLLGAWEVESQKFHSPIEALDGFVRFHISYHLDRQHAVFISYMELRNLESDGFARIENLRRYYEGFLRKIISLGKESGDFAVEDEPVATMAIIAMLTGVNTWFRNNGRLKTNEIEDIYVKMVLGSLGYKSEELDAAAKIRAIA
jgi:AcrR family transcriptional regulator